MALGTQAHKLYGQDTIGTISAVPRNKFNFTCSLDTIEGTVDLRRVASVVMPSYTNRVQTLNSYNKKKIVQTGVDYNPVILTVYDTRDAAIENFLKSYTAYYYGGPMNTPNIISHTVDGKGFKLQGSKNYIRTFFIERTNSSDDDNIIQIYNPIISNIDSDTLDYSDTGLVQYRLTFTYEGYDIKSR